MIVVVSSLIFLITGGRRRFATIGDRGYHLRSASVSRSFIYSVDVHGEHAVERPNQKAAVTGGHELKRVRSDRAV